MQCNWDTNSYGGEAMAQFCDTTTFMAGITPRFDQSELGCQRAALDKKNGHIGFEIIARDYESFVLAVCNTTQKNVVKPKLLKPWRLSLQWCLARKWASLILLFKVMHWRLSNRLIQKSHKWVDLATLCRASNKAWACPNHHMSSLLRGTLT